jgi:hypothetical protein
VKVAIELLLSEADTFTDRITGAVAVSGIRSTQVTVSPARCMECSVAHSRWATDGF